MSISSGLYRDLVHQDDPTFSTVPARNVSMALRQLRYEISVAR